MKRVLITGGAGFLGHHIVDYILQKTDWEIVILDRYDSSGNPNRVTDLDSFKAAPAGRVKFVWWDLKAELNDQIKATLGKFHYVVHLAASSHVDRSISDPVSFMQDNAIGTSNLLLWAKQGGMYQGRLLRDPRPSGSEGYPQDIQEPEGKFINFSTDEVFGPAPIGYAHKEDDAHHPSNPYAASKSAQEAIGTAFFVTYGLPVITTHTMNNFGERQHPEKLIPKTIRSVIREQPMPIFASMDDKGVMQAIGSRFWIHCWNTASAIYFLLNNGVAGEQYNIIGFDELSNLEIAEKVAGLVGKPLIPQFVDFHKTRPGHDMRYALDGSKMRDMGWTPELTFEESLDKTIKFSVDHPEWQ